MGLFSFNQLIRYTVHNKCENFSYHDLCEMRQCINASLQRIRASSLHTIRRAIREMTEKGNGDPDGHGVTKWQNIRKNTDFWFLKIPSGFEEVFKK